MEICKNTMPRGGKKAIKRLKKLFIIIMIVTLVMLVGGCSMLNMEESGMAGEDAPLGGILGNRQDSVSILVLLTVLSILPSILLMLTSFTRVIIVLSLIRNGLGLQQMPPNQVLIGLALFLTLFIMSPVIDTVKVNAYEPYINNQISEEQAIEEGMKPIRGFMLRQTYKKNLDFFLAASGETEAVEPEEVPNKALIPAFMVSELQRGFQIGFFIYIPFIVIDMVVASTLMSMGMMMLPPVVISLPFKLLLFVLVDGWTLTVQTLITSFG
ncbi:MAG: flagellar type III secretion system pore protein FliP [Christensenellales bacterium]|jgi:flagellar biosynthetic protein FliP